MDTSESPIRAGVWLTTTSYASTSSSSVGRSCVQKFYPTCEENNNTMIVLLRRNNRWLCRHKLDPNSRAITARCHELSVALLSLTCAFADGARRRNCKMVEPSLDHGNFFSMPRFLLSRTSLLNGHSQCRARHSKARLSTLFRFTCTVARYMYVSVSP